MLIGLRRQKNSNFKKLLIFSNIRKRRYKMKIKKLKLKIILFLLILVSSILFFSSADAAINKMINYQGKLTNTSGWAVPDGNYEFEFNIFTVGVGGSSVWTGLYTSGNAIPVSRGIFSVLLGSTNALNIDFTQDSYYLEVKIFNSGTSTWETFNNRKRIGAVPQAFNANGLYGDGFIDLDITSTAPQDAVNINYNPASGNNDALEITRGANGNGSALKVIQQGSGTIMSLFDETTEVMTVLNGGNVGIGITATDYKLYVNGTLGVGSTAYFASSVGIGKTNPAYTLDVNGTLGVGSTAYFASSVGIGTTNPSFALHVTGVGASNNIGIGLLSGGATSYTGFMIGRTGEDGTLGVAGTASHWTDFSTAGDVILRAINNDLILSSLEGAVRIGTSNPVTERMTILTNGNVGIGTTNPSYKLDVRGGGILASMDDFWTESRTEVFGDTAWAIDVFPVFAFARGKGTKASPLAVTANKSLGGMYFMGQYGTAPGNMTTFGSSPYIIGYAAENYTSSAYGAGFRFATVGIGSTADSIRMTLNPAGNLGIGTTNPTAKLSVAGGIRAGYTYASKIGRASCRERV